MTVSARRKGNFDAFFDIIKPGSSVKIAFTGTSQQSAALPDLAEVAQFFATQDCWVRMGANPTAAVNDGNSFFIPGGIICHYGVKSDDKIAAIMDSTAGSLHVIVAEAF